jgi:hypothetical protein
VATTSRPIVSPTYLRIIEYRTHLPAILQYLPLSVLSEAEPNQRFPLSVLSRINYLGRVESHRIMEYRTQFPASIHAVFYIMPIRVK